MFFRLNCQIDPSNTLFDGHVNQGLIMDKCIDCSRSPLESHEKHDYKLVFLTHIKFKCKRIFFIFFKL